MWCSNGLSEELRSEKFSQEPRGRKGRNPKRELAQARWKGEGLEAQFGEGAGLGRDVNP